MYQWTNAHEYITYILGGWSISPLCKHTQPALLVNALSFSINWSRTQPWDLIHVTFSVGTLIHSISIVIARNYIIML